jgi:hypothetical protein
MSNRYLPFILAAAVGASVYTSDAQARERGAEQADAFAAPRACAMLPNHDALQAALTFARNQENGGFNLDMWAAVVNRDGIVCAVAFTGTDRGSEWPGSRVIAAQKANTANAFSLPTLALSTANLWAAVQPGGSLFGLQESNPVATDVAYRGPTTRTAKRPTRWSASVSAV